MLSKILNKLSNLPFDIMDRIEKIIFDFLFLINQKLIYIHDDQNKKFSEIGLDREKSNIRLNKIKSQFPIINQPMNSEHQVLFSGLSEKKGFKPKNILEIGTFDGTNAFLISKLFPNSQITTIDLYDNDKDFSNTYSRGEANYLTSFIKNRNNVLLAAKNITFVQMNSLKLIFEQKKFDLIWIDGAHGYPILPVDLSNALRLISKNGIIMCDDIFTSKRIKPDDLYKSYAGYETLKALERCGLIKLSLFYKRINYLNNSAPKNRKFIAYVERN